VQLATAVDVVDVADEVDEADVADEVNAAGDDANLSASPRALGFGANQISEDDNGQFRNP